MRDDVKELADSTAVAEVEEKLGLSRTRDLAGAWWWLASAIAVGFSLFQLYTSAFGVLLAYQQRLVHLGLAMCLAFLLYPARRGRASHSVDALDAALAAAVLVVLAYVLHDFRAFAFRAGSPSAADVVVGLVFLLMVLELTRRVVGSPMVIIAAVFLVYALVGRSMPALVAHRGVTLSRLVDHMFLGTEGILGIPVGASATYIFIFVLFGAFLEATRAARFFLDLALALVGRAVGGPAKTSVISSALLGTISGSSIANVVTDGVVTIPLMVRNGYRPFFAAAVEAAASTGGQIMPPVMGAAAFIMVEYTGIRYNQIALAAAIPAILYFVGVYFSVHLEARRAGMRGLAPGEVPAFWKLLRGQGYLLLPLAVMMYSLAMGNTPMRAGALSIAAALAVSFVRRADRLGVSGILQALKSGGTAMVPVALACAAAGVIAGVISITGIGLKLASFIEVLSGGHLFVALFLTMVASLILGMGLPTTATYIVLVTIVAPALTQMGVPLLAAHLFVFYFGVVADITPPVALAAYAAAGLARANTFKTGVIATCIAMAGFLIPYVFIYSPSLLLLGREASLAWWAALAWRVACSTAGLWLIAAAVVGFARAPLSVLQRLVITGGGLLLIKPGIITDILGLLVLVGVLLWQRRGVPGHEETDADGQSGKRANVPIGD